MIAAMNWLASTYVPWFLDHLVEFKGDAAVWRKKMRSYPVNLIEHYTKQVRANVEKRFQELNSAGRIVPIPRGEEIWKLASGTRDATEYLARHELWLTGDFAAHIAVAEGHVTVKQVNEAHQRFAAEIRAGT